MIVNLGAYTKKENKKSSVHVNIDHINAIETTDGDEYIIVMISGGKYYISKSNAVIASRIVHAWAIFKAIKDAECMLEIGNLINEIKE